MTDHVEGSGSALKSGSDPALEMRTDASKTTTKAGGSKLDRGSAAWALYEGARDPYVIIVVIYVFAPYFATAVVGDPVKGQTPRRQHRHDLWPVHCPDRTVPRRLHR